MSWNEVLTIIMLACGPDVDCQAQRIQCTVKTTASPADKESNRRAVTHCLQLGRRLG